MRAGVCISMAWDHILGLAKVKSELSLYKCQRCVDHDRWCFSAVPSGRVACLHCGAKARERRFRPSLCGQTSTANHGQGWAKRKFRKPPHLADCGMGHEGLAAPLPSMLQTELFHVACGMSDMYVGIVLHCLRSSLWFCLSHAGCTEI